MASRPPPRDLQGPSPPRRAATTSPPPNYQQQDQNPVGISFPGRQNPHLRLNSGTDIPIIDGDPNARRRLVGRPPESSKPYGGNQSTRRPEMPSGLNTHIQRPGTGDSSASQSPNSPMDQSLDRLLPPPKSKAKKRNRPYRDETPPNHSPASTAPSSRRSSFSSNSPWDSHSDEEVNTQTIARQFNITPSAGMVLYPEDVEKDDYLHDPHEEKKTGNGRNIFTKRGLLNVGGLMLITLAILMLFVVFPAITFVTQVTYNHLTDCEKDPDCIWDAMPLLKNVRTTAIDPDTPEQYRNITAQDGRQLKLVFSDEFNTPGRSFYPDDDPFFEAVDLWYGVTLDLEWYDPDAITTANGVLTIQFDQFENHNLSYRSGMLQSWNKMCFKGGHLEASISLPGAGSVSGFWPGFWSMGNLGRPGYASTTDGMWPYSYWDKCDVGITKNQSSSDGLSFLPGMKLPACTCTDQDHPSPGKSRSAPEVDVLEATVGALNGQTIGMVSQSAQMAPFDIWYQPNYDFVELYDPTITNMNPYRGGPFQQALSGLSNLNNDWYDGNQFQKYAYEYVPGDQGHVVWYIGDTATWKLDGRALGPNGNIGQRVIPMEPMTIIANLGMSPTFAPIDNATIAPLMPATMRFDYIRIYQDEDGLLGCDPPGYPTTEYIETHPVSYLNVNKTMWEQTGYDWPTNDFVDKC